MLFIIFLSLAIAGFAVPVAVPGIDTPFESALAHDEDDRAFSCRDIHYFSQRPARQPPAPRIRPYIPDALRKPGKIPGPRARYPVCEVACGSK
jgi:hypothetical protein